LGSGDNANFPLERAPMAGDAQERLSANNPTDCVIGITLGEVQTSLLRAECSSGRNIISPLRQRLRLEYARHVGVDPRVEQPNDSVGEALRDA
jgi:hypothetical protein